mgnify:FL=1
MASTYTPLGIELMATGENAGTWGTKTNTNLNIIEQISGGYKVQTLNTAGAGANTTELTEADGATGATVATRIIVLGAESPQTISGNKIVTFPVGVENFYLIKNSTSGANTVQLKAASGSGATVTWSAIQKSWKLVYFDGVATNTGVYEIELASPPGGSDKQVQFNDNGSFGGISMGTNGQVLTTNGTTASFGDLAGGTDWQAVKTSTFTAVAGEGYFVNTTSGVITMNLPAGTLGQEIAFADYAGTFDSNTFTISANGSEKILGSTADLTVSVERAANTLVYTDGTQGWLLKTK